MGISPICPHAYMWAMKKKKFTVLLRGASLSTPSSAEPSTLFMSFIAPNQWLPSPSPRKHRMSNRNSLNIPFPAVTPYLPVWPLVLASPPHGKSLIRRACLYRCAWISSPYALSGTLLRLLFSVLWFQSPSFAWTIYMPTYKHGKICLWKQRNFPLASVPISYLQLSFLKQQ